MSTDRSPRLASSAVVRWAWLTVGLVSVGIGSIGIVVPGLPTTVFFVVAAWCFSRSSPRFEAWVLGLPKIGPMVQGHRDGLGMPRRAKVVAVAMMLAAVSSSVVFNWGRTALVIGLVVSGLIGSAVVTWRVPTRERVLAERAALASATDTV
jgi:uncharacterized membrane protein YbaN (DUF454 family)